MSVPPTQPEPFWLSVRRVAGTRKGVAAIIATVVGTIYALALTVSYFRGQMSPDVYWTKLGVAGGAVTAAWMVYIPTVAYEDASKNRPPQTPMVIAAGEGAKASSTTEVERLVADTVPVILTESVVPSDVSTSASVAVTPVDNPQKRSHRPE